MRIMKILLKSRKSKEALKILLILPIIGTLLPFIINLFAIFVYSLFRINFPPMDSVIRTIIALLYLIFDIAILIYSIRNHPEMISFIKIFLAVSLLFTGWYNFSFALSKFNGEQISLRLDIYYGSMWLFFPFAYNDQSPFYLLGMYFTELAFISGVPFLLILFILPSFLSLPFFFIWAGFSAFYIFSPYATLQEIGETIKEILEGRNLSVK